MLDEILDPLTKCLDTESARWAIDFRVAPTVLQRVGKLVVLANEGSIAPRERANYEVLINAAAFIAILKFKAPPRLALNLNQ